VTNFYILGKKGPSVPPQKKSENQNTTAETGLSAGKKSLYGKKSAL